MNEKLIEVGSSENYTTSKDNRVRLHKLSVEQNGDDRVTITGISRKAKAAKFPSLKLELDAEGRRAVAEAVGHGPVGNVMKWNARTYGKPHDGVQISTNIVSSDVRVFLEGKVFILTAADVVELARRAALGLTDSQPEPVEQSTGD